VTEVLWEWLHNVIPIEESERFRAFFIEVEWHVVAGALLQGCKRKPDNVEIIPTEPALFASSGTNFERARHSPCRLIKLANLFGQP
jgi:hypothetical protein